MRLIDRIQETDMSVANYCKVLACAQMTFSEVDMEDEDMISKLDPKKKMLFHAIDPENNIVKGGVFMISSPDTSDEIAQITTKEEQRMIFVNLIDFAFADGSMSNDEKRVMKRYLDSFNPDPDEFEIIFQVLSWKYNLS